MEGPFGGELLTCPTKSMNVPVVVVWRMTVSLSHNLSISFLNAVEVDRVSHVALDRKKLTPPREEMTSDHGLDHEYFLVLDVLVVATNLDTVNFYICGSYFLF